MKKFISLILSSVLIFSIMTVAVSAVETVQDPVIVYTVYPTANAVVADIVLTEAPYNADSTGKTDCAGIIQKAIDDLYARGGGTVFLPVGKYRICSPVSIKPFVSIHGDWQDPDEGNEYGTVIIADVPSTESSSPALFNVGGSAGAVGLTIWYPNQSIDNVVPYPYTFYVDGLGSNYMLHSIINCTMLNSYRGIGACVADGEGVNNAHEMTTIENVKGTCLSEGITFFNCADVDTTKTLYISGKYWSEAGEEYNAPELTDLNDYTYENLTAFTLGDLEWPEYCDIRAEHCKYGIYFAEGPRAAFSGTFFDMKLTDCETGIYAEPGSVMERDKQWGYSICNSLIDADKEAVNDYTKAVVMLTNTDISGKVKGKNIHREKASTYNCTLDYSRDYVKPVSKLFTVKADITGKTDASSAVQSKIDEAEATGGIVYMPAGIYRFDNPVTVPSGVELRGSGSVATRDQSGCSKGTLILSYCGYSEDSSPLITIDGDNAGIFAIRINYLKNCPKDDSGLYMETSPAVKIKGENNHVINCAAVLASCGFDFENCRNAYIRRCVGCCINSFIKVGNCDDMYIEGCLQNATAICRCGFSQMDIPEFSGWLNEAFIFVYAFIPILRKHCDYLTISDSKKVTVFNTFIYGGRRFMNAENSEIFVCGVGCDGQEKEQYSYILNSCDVTVIGTMHSTSNGKGSYLTYTTDGKTKLKMYDRISVDLCFNQYTLFEKIGPGEIESADMRTYFLQPLIRIYEMFGKLFSEK